MTQEQEAPVVEEQEAPAVEEPAQEPDAPETEAEELPEYSPDYSFKVLDEVKEFDEAFKPIITDKETEEKIRDLYTKAGGADHIKESRTKLQTELDEYKPIKDQYTTLQGSLNTISEFVKKDDMESFFETLQIPEDKILRYAQRVIARREMPAEQQQQWTQQREFQQQNQMLARQNQTLQSQQEQAQGQARLMELDNTIAAEKYATVSNAYDARVGKTGAFRDLAINQGKLHSYRGVDITADQAVQEAMNIVGPGPQTPAAPATVQAKPVIPNIQGGGASPAQKQVNSLDDIRAIAKQMNPTT